jgi:hypothetical protein
MTATAKGWWLGLAVALDASFALWLVLTWLFIFQQYSYPIDYPAPIIEAQARAKSLLFALTVLLPMTFVTYQKSARELPASLRVLSLVISGSSMAVAIAFVVWRYFR